MKKKGHDFAFVSNYHARLLVSCFCLLLVPALAGCQEVKPRQASVRIHAAGGPVDYRVEVAETRAQKSRGLMHREYLAPDRGMLFLYEPARETAMWMKNTYIPLDILFIDAAGTILRIEERTEPMSLQTIPSGGKVRAVLELNAGQTELRGIKAGDRVEYTMPDD